MYTFEFDIQKKEIVTNCNLYPTDILESESPWLYAKNNKYSNNNVNQLKVGKWMIFLSKDKVNEVWDSVKEGVVDGELWDSKVSTVNTKYPNHAIMIYTKDYTDLNDVIDVLDYLESSGIQPPHVTIYYKTDQQTQAGIYSGGGQRPWIYSSSTICKATNCGYITELTFQDDKVKLEVSDSVCENMYTYQYDVHKKEVINDCKLYPTDILESVSPFLYARNNKYSDGSINPLKVGKWMLFLSKDTVNEVWDKIKIAVTNGELWDSRVSTINTKSSTHAIMIYTKDFTDLNDVTDVLDYLESTGMKPPEVTIYYKTIQQTQAGIYSGSGRRPWIYSSATIDEIVVTPYTFPHF